MLASLLAAFRLQPPETSLSAMDRYGLASDTLALVVAGRAPVAQFLALLETAVSAGEDSLLVYGALDAGLRALAQALDCVEGSAGGDTGGALLMKQRFNGFVQRLLAPVAARLDAWSVQTAVSFRLKKN